MQSLKKTNLRALEISRKLGPEKTIEKLDQKKVIGRGGAGFPVAKKWEFSLNTKSDIKYVICNADEGEPGTFKDKYLIMNNPETLIEGIIIAAETINAKKAFIYLRGEYNSLEKNLRKKIQEVLKKANTKITIEIVNGGGAYICGEETALISSISNLRGQPNYKPPFPGVEGYKNKPTIVNNVESFVSLAQSLYFSNYNPDLRLFSISGAVEKPGVYELLIGVKFSEVMKLVKPKDKPRAIYFGCFGGCMKYKDIKITQENLAKEGCMIGTYTLIIANDKTSIVDMMYNISEFFTFESCGKCTPCREGNVQILKLIKKLRKEGLTKEEFDLLEKLAIHIQETSLCGLGQTSTIHITTAIKHFPEVFKEYSPHLVYSKIGE